jgi:hypothetical protein
MIAFSPVEARRRLEALDALEAPCVACGRVDWRIANHPTVVFAPEEGEEVIELIDDGLGARVFVVVCGSCGNARFHDWWVLAAGA